MKTEAKVIADSISPDGERLTTLQVCFPRFILAEFNTHRVVSRNFRSSRAVPVEKLIAEVRESPFLPSQFTRNRAGMQGGEALGGVELHRAEQAWREAAEIAAYYAELLADAGVHKQYANRGLEPYLYVHGVISATEWDNFFALRCHKDAQPEFQELACLIREALENSDPVERGHMTILRDHHSDWHLPYVTDGERAEYRLEWLKEASAARCAWVSYRPHDEGDGTNLEKIARTVKKLVSTPMHASPFEHVATPFSTLLPGHLTDSNFNNWIQWRHVLEAQRHG